MKLLMENWRAFLSEQNYQGNSFCKNFPDACAGAYGTARATMPQIASADAFETDIESPAGAGLETNEPEKIPDLGKATRAYLDSSDDQGQWPSGDQVKVEEVLDVSPSDLKPTQLDIYMDNAMKKAKAGADPNINWAPWDAAVLVSQDGFLLDGHHRWAATILYNAENPDDQKTMNIQQVAMPIEPLLNVANAYTDATGGTRHSGGGTTMQEDKK